MLSKRVSNRSLISTTNRDTKKYSAGLLVDTVCTLVRGDLLCDGALGRGSGVSLVHELGGLAQHQARRHDLARHVRQLELGRLEVRYRLLELLALLYRLNRNQMEILWLMHVQHVN